MCQRMRRQIDLGQLRAVDMRVDLRGRNIGMAQNLLQHTQVGTAREHVGGKGVAQGVGMEPNQPTWRPYRSHIACTAWRDRRRPFLFKKTAEVSIP